MCIYKEISSLFICLFLMFDSSVGRRFIFYAHRKYFITEIKSNFSSL